jgi:hypothetical protein
MKNSETHYNRLTEMHIITWNAALAFDYTNPDREILLKFTGLYMQLKYLDKYGEPGMMVLK